MKRLVCLLLLCLLLSGCSTQDYGEAQPDRYMEKPTVELPEKEAETVPEKEPEPIPESKPAVEIKLQRPSDLKPETLMVEGKHEGMLNKELAERFYREVLMTAIPTEGVEGETDYVFTLMEPIGPNRRTPEYEFSVEHRQLKGAEGCYTLTDEGYTLVMEIAYPSREIPESAECLKTEETDQFGFMTITAIYEDCFLATLTDEPNITVRVQVSAMEYGYGAWTVGDEVLPQFHFYRQQGNRIETVDGWNIHSREEVEEMERMEAVVY